MRQKTIALYKFNELPEDTQAKVIRDYRDNNHEIFWQSEIVDSLKELFKIANIKIVNYSIGSYSHSYIKYDLDDNIRELTGARAIAWLENNLFCKLRISRSEYLKKRKDFLSYGSSYRIGKIKSCPLTGYCFDDTLLESFIPNILKGYSLEACFNSLADLASKEIENEYEYQNSDEYIRDHLIANEYEYTEDGLMY